MIIDADQPIPQTLPLTGLAQSRKVPLAPKIGVPLCPWDSFSCPCPWTFFGGALEIPAILPYFPNWDNGDPGCNLNGSNSKGMLPSHIDNGTPLTYSTKLNELFKQKSVPC